MEHPLSRINLNICESHKLKFTLLTSVNKKEEEEITCIKIFDIGIPFELEISNHVILHVYTNRFFWSQYDCSKIITQIRCRSIQHFCII